MVKCPSDILPKRKYYGKMSFWTLYLIDFGYGKMSPNFLGKVSPPGIFKFWHMVKCYFSELIKCLQLVKCRISEKKIKLVNCPLQKLIKCLLCTMLKYPKEFMVKCL